MKYITIPFKRGANPTIDMSHELEGYSSPVYILLDVSKANPINKNNIFDLEYFESRQQLESYAYKNTKYTPVKSWENCSEFGKIKVDKSSKNYTNKSNNMYDMDKIINDSIQDSIKRSVEELSNDTIY